MDLLVWLASPGRKLYAEQFPNLIGLAVPCCASEDDADLVFGEPRYDPDSTVLVEASGSKSGRKPGSQRKVRIVDTATKEDQENVKLPNVSTPVESAKLTAENMAAALESPQPPRPVKPPTLLDLC